MVVKNKDKANFPKPLPEARYDKDNRRLCSAMRTDGAPCKGPAVTGSKACRFHGGNSLISRRTHQLHLAALVDPAIARLADEMDNAESSSDRLRAAENILDRAGYGRKINVADEGYAKALLVERLLSMRKTDYDGQIAFDPDALEIEGEIVD